MSTDTWAPLPPKISQALETAATHRRLTRLHGRECPRPLHPVGPEDATDPAEGCAIEGDVRCFRATGRLQLFWLWNAQCRRRRRSASREKDSSSRCRRWAAPRCILPPHPAVVSYLRHRAKSAAPWWPVHYPYPAEPGNQPRAGTRARRARGSGRPGGGGAGGSRRTRGAKAPKTIRSKGPLGHQGGHRVTTAVAGRH